MTLETDRVSLVLITMRPASPDYPLPPKIQTQAACLSTSKVTIWKTSRPPNCIFSCRNIQNMTWCVHPVCCPKLSMTSPPLSWTWGSSRKAWSSPVLTGCSRSWKEGLRLLCAPSPRPLSLPLPAIPVCSLWMNEFYMKDATPKKTRLHCPTKSPPPPAALSPHSLRGREQCCRFPSTCLRWASRQRSQK